MPAPVEPPLPVPVEPLNREELLSDFKRMLREIMAESRPGEGPKKGNGHNGHE